MNYLQTPILSILRAGFRTRNRRSGSDGRTNPGKVLLGLLAMLLCGASQLPAQLTSGTILGSVQDTTGAVIPGATITAAASAIGSSRTVQSAGNGTFAIPNLPAGTYHLTVAAKGFETSQKDGVILSSTDKLNAGAFKLKIGAESTTVTVSADTGQLQIQADSGERSDLITGKQLNDIALNGRNVLDILRVVPGVSGVGTFGISGTGGLADYSVNGTRQNEHNFTIDGATNVDSGDNGGTQVTINTDAIGEVKVLTSNYQAEFGEAGGGSIVVTSRGGTNDFHGNLHFFHRNEGLDANSWINDHNGTAKNLYRINTFGYQIGGPIKRDKLFFFFSNEFYRQLIPAGVDTYHTPTALERAGDFSQSVDSNGNPITIYNPATGLPFAGNKIDPAALTPAQAQVFTQIQTILNLYPLPNVTTQPSYNRADPLSYSDPRTEYIGRVDYQISPSERIFARYIRNQESLTGPIGVFGLQCLGSLEIPGGCTKSQPGWNLSVNLTSTLRSDLLNEFNIGPSVYRTSIAGTNGNITVGANNIALPLLFPTSGTTSIPDLGFSGNGQNYPYTYLGSTPWHQADTSITANDNLTYSRGSHTVKVGAFFQRSRKDQISYGNSNGQFSFSSCSTSQLGCANGGSNDTTQGSPIASALLGNFQSFNQSSARPTGFFRYNQVEFYGQDTWQVSPRLTLDYGARFVYIPPQYDAKNQIALFSPKAYNASTAVQVDTSGNIIAGSGDPFDGIVTSASGKLPKGGWNSQGIMFEPRFGFAYDLFGDHKGVLRGGFGTSHDREQGNLIFNTVFGNPLLVTNPTITNGTIEGIAGATQQSAGVLGGIYGADVSGQVPVVYSYSLGIQREIARDVTLDVAYVGTLGRHLVTARDINTIPYGTTFTRAAQDPSQFPGGVVPQTEANLPPEYAAAGYSFSGQHAYAQNYLSPYKGYGQMEYYKFDGNSNYNSLQVSVQRRFGHGLTFGAVYTWSKTLTVSTDDESFVDPFNPRKYSYGVAGFDRRNVASINYVYDLPSPVKMFHGPRWLGLATDGFQLSGLADMQSGVPVRNALYAPANVLTGGSQYSKTPPLFAGVDHLGNPLLPIIGQPSSGAPGSIRQGGLVTWDSSIFKNFAFGEVSKGRYLQLRGEFFNVLNHPNFSSRDYGQNVTTPSYNGDGTYTALAVTKDGNYGNPTSTYSETGPGGPRVIQLAAKLYF